MKKPEYRVFSRKSQHYLAKSMPTAKPCMGTQLSFGFSGLGLPEGGKACLMEGISCTKTVRSYAAHWNRAFFVGSGQGCPGILIQRVFSQMPAGLSGILKGKRSTPCDIDQFDVLDFCPGDKPVLQFIAVGVGEAQRRGKTDNAQDIAVGFIRAGFILGCA